MYPHPTVILPSRSEASGPPRPLVAHMDRFDATVFVVLISTVLAMTAYTLARGQQLLALLLAVLATVCVTAITHPRAYRLAAMAGLLAIPFVSATPAFRPLEYDYLIYLAAFSLMLVGLGVFQEAPIPATLGSAYLGYVLLAGSIVAISAQGIQDGIRVLPTLMVSFGMYVLIIRSDKLERRLFLGGLFVLGAVQSVVAILQVFTGWPVFSTVLPTLFKEGRNYFAYVIPGMGTTVTLGSGTFYHFNLLGSVLAMLTPIAFALWLERSRSALRIALFGLLAAGTVCTFSRGSLLAVTLGIAILLFGEYRRGRRQASIVIISALGVIALLIVNVASRYVEASGNIAIRQSTWWYAINDALEQPSNLLIGYGFLHFQRAVLSPGDSGEGVRSFVLPFLHSGSLQLLLEFGVVGVVLFALWVATAVRRSRSCSESYLVRGLVAATAAFVCYQFVENILFAYPGILFAVVLGLLEAESLQTPLESDSDLTRRDSWLSATRHGAR